MCQPEPARRILSLSRIILGLLAAFSLGACAGSRGPLEALPKQPPSLAPPAGLQTVLPAPSELTEGRRPSAAQLDLSGDQNDPLSPSSHVFDAGFGVMDYYSLYSPGGPLDAAAYALYSFPLAGYSGPGRLHLGWWVPPAQGSIWIGLADYASNRWKWQVEPANGVLPFDLASGNFESSGGFLHVAVLLVSNIECDLASISLGDNTPPVLRFNTSYDFVNPGVVTTIDVSSSYDPDGSIVKFEFDPENDGSFVDKGLSSSITHVFSGGGQHLVSVRITDNSGAAVTSQHIVFVSYQQSLMGNSGQNSTESVVMDSPNGLTFYAGTLQDLGQGGEEAYIGAYRFPGNPAWEKTFGGAGKDTFTSLALDQSGNVFVAGNVNNDDSSGTGVLVEFTENGTLVGEKQWGGSFAGKQRLAAAGNGKLYYCSNLYVDSFHPHKIYMAQLDASGTVLWQKTFACGDEATCDDCCVDADGNLYVCGKASGLGTDGLSALVLSLDPSGALRFAKSMDTGFDDEFYGLSCNDPLIYLAGKQDDNQLGGNALLASVDTSGALQWVESYSLSDNDEEFYSHGAAGPGGGALFAGDERPPQDSLQAMFVQVLPDGSLGLQGSFGSPNKDDEGFCVTLGSLGDVYLGGSVAEPSSAAFSTLNGTTAALSDSLDDIAGGSLDDVDLGLQASNVALANLSGATHGSGGAMLTQYFPPSGT